MRGRIPTWPPAWPEISEAVRDCVSSGQWGRYHSQTTSELQQQLCLFTSRRHTRLCCSGTAAVEIALRAAGVKPGDAVIVAAMDFPGNFRSIEAVGARPVLVDLQDDQPCISANDVARIASIDVGYPVVAVIASSLFGHAADLAALQAICTGKGWTLINDACQVMGMTIDDRPVESIGDVATTSFGGSKVVTAGAGGAVFVDSDQMLSRMDRWMDRPGQTFPISPLQAAVIQPQLRRLKEMHAVRNANARWLCEQLDDGDTRVRPMPNQAAVVDPAYYKLGFETKTHQAAARAIARADRIGLPIGPAFRSMHRSSPRRCSKPVPLENAARVAQQWILLDQRLLLISQHDRKPLARTLRWITQED